MSFRLCAFHRISSFFIGLFLFFAASVASSQEMIILQFVLNGEPVGEFIMQRTSDGDIWIKREDLGKTRLRAGVGMDIDHSGERYVSLRSIEGLTFAVDEQEAGLRVQAPPDLFSPQVLNISYQRPYEVTYTKDTSAFLNYAFQVSSRDPSLSVSAEAGLRIGNYLGLSTFSYTKGDEINKAVRLLTSVGTDDRGRMRTYILGDHPAFSNVLGSNLVVGGINVSKNYGLDPYFIRFPSLSLGGVLESPSEVDVLIDGQRVRKERLQPGSFLFTDVPAVVGLGDAAVVIRDAFGTERAITSSFYYSDSLLQKGLHEYSYTLGFRREKLGVESFSYGDPVAMAFHNYGFTDAIKGGVFLEASDDVITGGPAASFLLPDLGVINTSLAVSRSGDGSGFGASLDYTFRSKRFNARLGIRSFSKEFSSLTIGRNDRKPSLEFSGAVGVTSTILGSVTVEYARAKMHFGEDRSRLAVSYSKAVRNDLSLFASAARTEEGGDRRDEVFFGLTFYFGKGVTGNLSVSEGTSDATRARAGLQKSLPVGTGFGFNLDTEIGEGATNGRAEMRYQNRYGIYGLEYTRLEGSDRVNASLAGGIGYIGGSFFLSRPILDSFAKVSVAELKDVRVYSFGNEVGKTDMHGNVIVPLMTSYTDNRVDIEAVDIPLNYNIPKLTKYVSPPLRGGALIKFDVARIQGITGRLVIVEEGSRIAPEAGEIHVSVEGKTIVGLIGRSGEFYIENVPSGRHAGKGVSLPGECKFDIMIPESEDPWLNIGEVVCEVNK